MNDSNSIIICDGYSKMDFARVTKMLSAAYWSKGIKIDEVMKCAVNSALVVGAFVDGNQIGYARAVSDKTKFAYIADVYVDENYRKQGIGQKIINYILGHEDFTDISQWLLVTKDAHGVYKKCGFDILDRPLDWMQIRKPWTER